MPILGRLTCSILGTIVAIFVPTFAAAQQGKQQVVMLPDPTPRQPDLEQKYSQTAPSGTVADHAALVLSQERRALITKASNQLASLAAVLNSSLLKHEKGASLAPEVEVAELIEKLAKNVNAAVKVNGKAPKADPVKTDVATNASSVPVEAPEVQLKQDAGKLVVVAYELVAEVDKTDQNTLSIGVLTKSAELEREARSLKQRLKKRANG